MTLGKTIESVACNTAYGWLAKNIDVSVNLKVSDYPCDSVESWIRGCAEL